jgi:hypothetical protein
MATFTNETFRKHDGYFTPKSAWESIKEYIPKNKLIWECFYGNGDSAKFLTELGFDVISEDINFYNHNMGEILVSNPPFSDCANVLDRLAELDKPFIMIMPVSKMSCRYFKKHQKFREGIQLISPARRINFGKWENNKLTPTSSVNFDCYFYCYKIGLPRDIIHL